jgi:EthD domain
MLTLDLLLTLAPQQPSDAFDGPLAGEAARIATLMPPGTAMRVVHNLRHHRGAAIAAGSSLDRFDDLVTTGLVPNATRVQITSFDAVLEISIPDDSDPKVVLDAIDGLASRLAPAVDPQRSAAAFGADYPIVDGEGALQVFVCLRRMPGLSHDQFCDYWRNDLVKHTTKTPGKTAYRQLHADPALTARAATAAGVAIDDVDGVALEFYPAVEGLYLATDWANQPNSAMTQSEAQMIDFGRGAIVGYSPPT